MVIFQVFFSNFLMSFFSQKATNFPETKKLGMFALQLADLYASHGIELSDDEKKKLCELVGGNEQFERSDIAL